MSENVIDLAGTSSDGEKDVKPAEEGSHDRDALQVRKISATSVPCTLFSAPCNLCVHLHLGY
jgi:hypothetical protein